MLDMRRELMASVSHELRTPLTCVSGFAETLRTHWKGLSENERQTFVEKICQHANELADLVDRLLDFSELESGRISAGITSLDLRDEVDATVQALRPQVADRAVDIRVPHWPVLADAVLLRRTLTNLLSNAAKYSERGTPITVQAAATHGSVRIEVVDRGVGLTPDEAARVFDPFWRAAHVATTHLRGTGLGLALVKEYVRVMGGEVAVRSEPGHGSTFLFTLPVPDSVSVS